MCRVDTVEVSSNNLTTNKVLFPEQFAIEAQYTSYPVYYEYLRNKVVSIMNLLLHFALQIIKRSLRFLVK